MNVKSDKKEVEKIYTRLDTAKYILDISYKLITHYDSKTNQLLTLIGYDFTILTLILTLAFDKISMLNSFRKFTISGFIFIDFVMIIISLVLIRNALIPHTNTVVKIEKPKKGLIYFMDIKNNLGEEEYVRILLGEQLPTSSKHYEQDCEYSFEKCIIEDAARDIYAHSEILQLKTKYVKYAFNISIVTSGLCVLTVALIYIFSILGI